MKAKEQAEKEGGGLEENLGEAKVNGTSNRISFNFSYCFGGIF